MKFERAFLSVAICAALATLAGCKPSPPAATPGAPSAAARGPVDPNETADQFIARVNKEMRED